jgi:hypothetical protein
MAEEISIAGSEYRAKIRDPALVLFLSIITLGIYAAFWWYVVNRELSDLGRQRRTKDLGENPTLSLLAYVLGGFLLYIPTVWTIVATARRIQNAQRLVNAGPIMNGWGLAALWIFTLGLGAFVYMQVCLNRVWRTQPVALAHGPGGRDADLERLAKLQELRSSGAITDEEFAAEKSRILPDPH